MHITRLRQAMIPLLTASLLMPRVLVIAMLKLQQQQPVAASLVVEKLFWLARTKTRMLVVRQQGRSDWPRGLFRRKGMKG